MAIRHAARPFRPESPARQRGQGHSCPARAGLLPRRPCRPERLEGGRIRHGHPHPLLVAAGKDTSVFIRGIHIKKDSVPQQGTVAQGNAHALLSGFAPVRGVQHTHGRNGGIAAQIVQNPLLVIPESPCSRNADCLQAWPPQPHAEPFPPANRSSSRKNRMQVQTPARKAAQFLFAATTSWLTPCKTKKSCLHIPVVSHS